MLNDHTGTRYRQLENEHEYKLWANTIPNIEFTPTNHIPMVPKNVSRREEDAKEGATNGGRSHGGSEGSPGQQKPCDRLSLDLPLRASERVAERTGSQGAKQHLLSP